MEEIEKNNNFEDLNIFNEISQNSNIKNDASKIKGENNIYDYLNSYTNIFKIINYLLFLILILSATYVYIQKSESFYQKSYLNLLCPLILGKENSNYIYGEDCSSSTSYNTKITNDLNTLEQEQFNKIVKNVPKIYAVTSSNTKEKEFLLFRTKERLKVLNIIEEFEKLRNEYTYIDKKKIVCNNVSIDSKNVLTVNCDAYSSYWDNDIIGYDGIKELNGTSISVAMSFLNYIQTKSSKFTIINKQKTFSQEFTDIGFYIYKTSLSLEMKYNGDNLSF